MLVMPHGGQYWQYQYRFEGRRKVISYGTFPQVSEDRARSRHRVARELLAAGVDPMLKRKELRRDGCADSHLFFGASRFHHDILCVHVVIVRGAGGTLQS